MSDASDDANRWSWVTPDGKTITGAKGELMLALRGEKLPAGTLVWRSGWAEWLPAARVTELKSVLPPGRAEPAQAPKLSAAQGQPTAAAPQTASRPPPAPVRHGATGQSQPPPAPVRHGATGQSQPPPAPVRGATSRPPPAPVRHREQPAGAQPAIPVLPAMTGVAMAATGAAQARPRGVSILGPPRDQMTNSMPPRAPMPTLGGEEGTNIKATLRPPGAVPPPPRVGGGPLLGPPSARLEEEMPTQRKLPTMSAGFSGGASRDDAPPPTELRSAVVMPASLEAATTQPGGPPQYFDATLGSTPFESGSVPEVLQAAPPSTTLESTEPSVPAPSAKADGLSWTVPMPKAVVIALVVFVSGLLLAGSGALVFSSTHKRLASTPSASASSVVPAADTAPGCRLVAPAARLATTVERSVQPSLAELVRGERVAVGFAPVPKTAGGLLVKLETLDAERAPDQTGDSVVRSSVPLVIEGSAKFSADRADSELTGARTLADGATLGFAGADLVRRVGGKKTVLFPGAAGEKTTDPRVASSAAGTLVTFRRGGLSGQVLYGWLAPNGSALGALAPVAAPSVKLSGTPDAAANGSGGVLAFAGRPSDTAEWRVQLVSVPLRGPAAARAFQTPPGGSGGGNIAPTVSALGADGWVLQWTEGATGAYEVRLQELSAKLEPLGEARLVSPKGANAGQGAVLSTGSRVLSVFVQTTAGHDELWGASFECK